MVDAAEAINCEGLSVVQQDGRNRRQVGGFGLTSLEFPTFLATLQAFAALVAARARVA